MDMARTLITEIRPIWPMGVAAGFLAIFNVANGTVMLVSPARWFGAVPGVAETGGFNPHFIADIGLVHMLIGLQFAIGALRTEHRRALWGSAAAWLAAHALFHLWQVAVGICGPDALLRDFPGVTLPALIALGLTSMEWRTS